MLPKKHVYVSPKKPEKEKPQKSDSKAEKLMWSATTTAVSPSPPKQRAVVCYTKELVCRCGILAKNHSCFSDTLSKSSANFEVT